MANIEKIGLTEKEYKLYEILLRLGETPVNRLITESAFKRPTVYKSMYGLERKGLATQRDIAGKTHFKPEPPQKLLKVADDRTRELEQARSDINSMMPFLTSQFLLSTEKPVVTTFEGVKGLKEVFMDTINVGETIYAILEKEEIDPTLDTWLKSRYLGLRKEKGIQAEVIVSSDKSSADYVKLMQTTKLGRTIMVPARKYSFKHEINIYGDKVAFIDYKKGGPLIGIIIHHPDIAKSTKAWFDLAWEGAVAQSKPN